jgi:ribosomal protein S12 methylthiotransferase accessory factor
MCAGNTPEEAICQGICEIFERHIIKQIYKGTIQDVPNIPLSVVKQFDIYNIIEEITDRGYRLIIKDLTMGGKLPVLGVLLLTPESDKYRMSFASDVLFEATIQRCLSELYQGIDSGSIQDHMNRLDLSDNQFQAREFSSDHRQKLFEKNKILAHGKGQLPNHIFIYPSYASDYQAAFIDTFEDHKKSLQFLLRIVQNFGWKLFIRDVSFLGFPAYKIYIPQVSTTYEFIDNSDDINELMSLLQTREKTKNVFRLTQLNNEELVGVADALETQLDNPRYFNLRKGTVKQLRLGFLKEDAGINTLDTEILMVLVYNRLGNYEKAFYHLDNYLKHKQENNIEIDNPEYYQGALIFFKMKAKKYQDQTIINTLLSFSGKETAEEILNDLSDPSKSFQYYDLPVCGDGDCEHCPAINQCHFPKWSDIITRMNEKMKESFPNQVESLGFLHHISGR